MRSGQVALPEGFGYWLVKFDGLEGNGDKEGGLFIFFERHPVPDALSFFGSARVAYERNAYDIWWEIVVEKDKRFGGFAI